MSKTNSKIKELARDLRQVHSKKYMDLFFDVVDFFNKLFREQAKEYIKSLDKYPELKEINKTQTDEEKEKYEKLIELFRRVIELGEEEAYEEILRDCIRAGESEDIIISQKPKKEPLSEEITSLGWSGIVSVNETTDKQIKKIIYDGITDGLLKKEIAELITEKFTNYSLYRSSLCAHMVISEYYSKGKFEEYEKIANEIGVEGRKRSVTQHDDGVRKSHKKNEEDGRIKRKQVFSGTGTLFTPHGYNCRCFISYSMTNPKTGFMSEEDEEDYTEEQNKKFDEHIKTSVFINEEKDRSLMRKYGLNDRELASVRFFTGTGHRILNNGYKRNESLLDYELDQFSAGIKYFRNTLNKVKKVNTYEGKLYRGHKTRKSGYEELLGYKKGDTYSLSSFFSSSLDLKTAKDFMSDDYKVLFYLDTKKGIDISELALSTAEEEILFIPKTLFRVDNTKIEDNILKIFLKDL